MKNDGMMAAVALAAGLDETTAKTLKVDAAFIKQHFARVADELAGEGATAEQQRIAGIEAAAMPGHEEIIKAHKADVSKTPADAALAVIGAEKAKLAAMKGSLEADEKKLKGLKSVATATGDTPEKPKRTARQLADAGKAYMAEQAAKGITVGAAQAIQHIQSQEG
jgi:hypothetical protein